ncbi:hypothetical protein SFC79_02765 [Nocardioides sp. S-58]|uniref:Lipoprotein n=1 Tax=Nocardioides renjunii TaxID=3095075 RepID=A0ABU5K6S9_9ACTN|nr:hypothetical protein [Nocardioides sp. S-58]MDZ5660675.1 hypothetical protein [Nocardioides sp. S-58]
MVDRSPEWVVSGLLTLFSGRHLMHVRRALAAALAVPLLLAGCSEDKPEPKMPDPPPTSTSPTDEPTETETAEAESAEDFIRRWQAEALGAQNNGDTKDYRELGPRCRPCSDFADQVDQIYANGGSVELTSLRVVGVESAGGADQYRLTRVLGRTRVLDAKGDETQSFEGGREVLNVFLERTRESWRVKNFLRTAA